MGTMVKMITFKKRLPQRRAITSSIFPINRASLPAGEVLFWSKVMKLCECGCGKATKIITCTNNKWGRTKGEYSRFVNGHNTLTEKAKKHISETSIARGAKPPSRKGKQHTSKTKGKISEALKGKNNPMYGVYRYGENAANWIDGRSFEPYPPSFNQQLKDRIRVRDNFICQKCGVPELECDTKLAIHHIDYNKKNCSENNLISLCNSCNGKVNANREYWTNYFQQIFGGAFFF